MSQDALRVVTIIASTRQGRFGPTIARWFVRRASRREDIAVEVLDLAEIRIPDVLTNEPPPSVAESTAVLAGADAFVVVTPEYNHSFPASLKSAIDWHPVEWRARPVGFVSYGGMSGGLRAVEQLRQVFNELHAVPIRNSVSFHHAWEQFDAHGEPKDPEGCNAAADAMLDHLVWWAHSLREARARRPYAV